MKKILTFALAALMIASMSVPVFASNIDERARIGVEIVSADEIEVVREDVSTFEAARDIGFTAFASQRSSNTLQRGATWQFGGSRIWGTVGGVYGAKPSGWTQQVNDTTGKVENTYHYTNVYFNWLGSQRGASGRVWGYGKVSATGSQCIPDVVNGVLTVKYGVNND